MSSLPLIFISAVSRELRSGRQLAANGADRRPMDPGAPLLTRPAALIGLSIPLFLIVLVVALIAYQAVTTV